MRELPFRQALSYKTDGFCSQQQESSAVNLPKNVDWRKLGCVATVRNQDEISASSAFSAVSPNGFALQAVFLFLRVDCLIFYFLLLCKCRMSLSSIE